MEIQINTTDDLLKFIKRNDINANDALEVVCKFLNVYCFGFKYSKEQVIQYTEHYINKFCRDNEGEKPLFLQQQQQEFSIKDIFLI
jgi:hypothetical protein